MNTTPPTPLRNNDADARSAETLRMLLAIKDPMHKFLITLVVEVLWLMHTFGIEPQHDTDQA